MFRRIWNDAVWSKVIAAGFIGLCSYFSWNYISEAFHWLVGTLLGLVGWLGERTAIANWIVAVLGICAGFVGVTIGRWAMNLIGRSGPKGKPYESLSGQQQRYLASIFRTGTRRFEESYETSKLRWFEELEAWNYVQDVHVSIHIGGAPYPYAVTEAGWRELEKKLGASN